MNFRTKEQILEEQPFIERKMKYRGNVYKLTNTTHDISHGEFNDLTCYTYQYQMENQNILLYCRKGKIVYVEIDVDLDEK